MPPSRSVLIRSAPGRSAPAHRGAQPFSRAAPSSRPAPAQVETQVRRLLAERLPRELPLEGVRLGGLPPEPPPRLPTGLPEVDRLLGGGFPCGRLSEITGPLSSGRTALALAALARLTRRGHLAAVVDLADALDPTHTARLGADLKRVLWVRAPELKLALRSAERLLEGGGFGLVLLDLDRPLHGLRPQRRSGRCAQPAPLSVPPAAWVRLARRAAATGAALLLLAPERVAGSFAELALEARPRAARFAFSPPWLEGLETQVVLARSRRAPSASSAVVRLPTPGEPGAG